MKNDKIVLVLLLGSVVLSGLSTIVTRDEERRYNALNSLATSFSAAALALVTANSNKGDNDGDIK